MANLEYRDAEKDDAYSSVQCVEAACRFVERNHAEDNWHLHLELFDPHEPFDCPQAYLDAYDDQWDGPPTTCPDYAPLDRDRDTPKAVDHLRRAYAATITMNDRKLGQLFDMMDRFSMWDDTAVILTTDHGYLLGEHGLWAKNYMQCYDELVHLPLIVRYPGATPGRRQALTGAIDIMPTILEMHGARDIPESVMGKSIVPLLKEDGHHHDGLLFGYFGREVNMTDGVHTYHRMPTPNSTCDFHFTDLNMVDPCSVLKAELGTHLKHSNGIPHFRITRQSVLPQGCDGHHLIYSLENDPNHNRAVHDDKLESELTKKLRMLLQEADAPECQYRRLAIEQSAEQSVAQRRGKPRA